MQYVHFTVAYWCVLVAALLPYFCAGVAKFGAEPGRPAYDNSNPRAWLAQQTQPWRVRANSAQSNGFESLPFFIGAVIIAHQLGAAQGRLDILAFLYVVLRMLYCIAYVAGFATPRTILWILALTINVTILFIGYR